MTIADALIERDLETTASKPVNRTAVPARVA